MSAAVAVVETTEYTDVVVVGHRDTKRVDIESDDFIIRMTPMKAFELALAVLTVAKELR